MPESRKKSQHTAAQRKKPDAGHAGALLGWAGDNMLRQFISLREIVMLSDAPSIKEDVFSRGIEVLSADERKQLQQAYMEFGKMMKKAAKGKPAPGFTVESPEVQAALSSLVDTGFHYILAPDKSGLIAQSVVAAAVSGFEVLIGSIAREALNVNKAALEKSEYEFTLEELMQFESIEEARRELISRRIDALLLKSVDEWSSWCKRTLQFDLPSLTSDWPTVREIFARRNIIVHNAGIVNRRYLNIAQDASITLPKGVKAGDFLETSSDYAFSAIQLLLALGLRLTFATWRKLYPKEAPEAAVWLLGREEAVSYYGMWVSALELSHALRNVRARRAITCMAEVHGWLARIHLDGRDSVAEEVGDWDIGGLNTTFAVYRQCLLGNNQAAIDMIRKHLGEPGLTKYEIYSDPIFEEVKEEALAPYMSQSSDAVTESEDQTSSE